ncbi:Cytochrome b5 [Zea mays]|uniref:Cytochrome b5 n=1 Tax=Zea mays TaxID=4577 RepID=A0A1D6GGW8_MAIZE|nr:Cytochrome b5 [Zea mays]
MPTLTKLYSMKEAALHNTPDDCWVVVDGKIYDVTKYLEDHPGGADVLLEATGAASLVRMLQKNLTMQGTARVPRS